MALGAHYLHGVGFIVDTPNDTDAPLRPHARWFPTVLDCDRAYPEEQVILPGRCRK